MSEPAVESVSTPGPAPTSAEIEERVTQVLTTHGPLPLSKLLDTLDPFGAGHEAAITAVVERIAKPTLTGDVYALETSSGPSAEQIHAVMSDISGRTLANLVEWFSDRLRDEAALMAPLSEAAYQDAADGLWYARFVVDGEFILDEEENRRLRGQSRLRAMDDMYPAELAELLGDVAVWDPIAGRYVKKTETRGPISVHQGVESVPVPPPSPTEVDPPPPPSPRGKRKRKRSEEDEPEPRPKKGKSHAGAGNRTKLVQCRGETQAGKRCKIKQRRLPVVAWYCSKHQRMDV